MRTIRSPASAEPVRSGTAWVIGLAIAILAATACSSTTSTSSDVTPSAITGPTTTDSPSQSPSEAPTKDRPQMLDTPTRVRAHVLSGNLVRVKWNARERDVRAFQIYDSSYRPVGGRVPADERFADVYTSYGTHCYQVEAIAKHGARDSLQSRGCGMVAVTAGPVPPIVGTWYRIGQIGEGDLTPTPVNGPILVVYANGTYRLGSNKKGWWRVDPEFEGYQLFACSACPDEHGSLEGDELTLSCCSVRSVYRRT